MKRLTKYNDNHYSVDNSLINKAIEKLGKLEDIEEDNEMSFQEIIDVEKKFFHDKCIYIKKSYDKTARKIELANYTISTVFNDYNFMLIRDDLNDIIYLDFFRYKHTWALTREDLEENEENK